VRIRDLGKLEGDIMLFGGPYSNFQALSALMAEADKRAIPSSRRICTGDVVAYCGEPVACVDRMRQGAFPVVRGNCEIQLAGDQPDCGCGFADGSVCATLSDEWYAYARGVLPAHARKWMALLPDMLVFSANGARYAVIHGGVRNVSRFLWPTDREAGFESEINEINRVAGPVDGVIAGHCGIAFERRIARTHWINAGVIGLPAHDGRQSTAFAILSPDGVRFERLTYDVATAAAMMARAGLGAEYRKSLQSGYWPSEDNLPPGLCQGSAMG